MRSGLANLYQYLVFSFQETCPEQFEGVVSWVNTISLCLEPPLQHRLIIMLQRLCRFPLLALPPDLSDHLRVERLIQVLKVVQLVLRWKRRVLGVISQLCLLFGLSSER